MRYTRLRLLIADVITAAGSMRQAAEIEIAQERDRGALAGEVDRMQAAAHCMLELLDCSEEHSSTN